MNRVFSMLLLIAVAVVSVSAFQPTHYTPPRLSTVALQSVSRKELLAATVSAAVMTTSTAALADEYDDARNAARAKKQGGGASLMAAPLIGGVVLSLPFFLPSILRLLGIKNDKMD